MRSFRWLELGVLALAIARGVAFAQGCVVEGNLVVNPDLETSATAWSSTHAALAVGWSPGFDSDGEACSGALAATLSTPTPLSTIAVQCIDGIIDSSLYDYGGDVLVALGEPADGQTTIWLYWFPGLGCSGALLGTATAAATVPPPFDAWVRLSGSAIDPPAGAESVGFALVMIRTVGGGDSYSALFDDLFLRLSATGCDDIFDDGFEISDTTCWSSTVP